MLTKDKEARHAHFQVFPTKKNQQKHRKKRKKNTNFLKSTFYLNFLSLTFQILNTLPLAVNKSFLSFPEHGCRTQEMIKTIY
jgi:hypothetical protein